MFVDASPKYTNSDINYKKENPKVMKRFTRKTKNISDYSKTKMAIGSGFTSYTDTGYDSNKMKKAPEKLKRAMFKTSSRGIAAALQKK